MIQKHGSVIIHNILAYLTLSLNATQKHGQENDVASPESTSFIRFFHVGPMFCCFPANFIPSTYTDKNSPFSGFNLELFSQPCKKKNFLELLVLQYACQKDDRRDSVQEERLGLPCWTMIKAICVVVDESKCLDTPILEFLIICEHLPFLLGF